jgi:transposase
MRLTGMLREAGISLIAVDIHGAPVVAVRVEHDVKVRHEDRAIRRSSQEGYVGTKTCKESAFCFGNPDLARANEIEFIAHDEAETTTPGIAFTRFLEDGRICMTNNAAERALRGVAVGRRNWTFAGSDAGGQRAAAVYSLVETCKLNDIDPQAWLADVLARLPDHPAKRIDELLPWHWKERQIAATVAAQPLKQTLMQITCGVGRTGTPEIAVSTVVVPRLKSRLAQLAKATPAELSRDIRKIVVMIEQAEAVATFLSRP